MGMVPADQAAEMTPRMPAAKSRSLVPQDAALRQVRSEAPEPSKGRPAIAQSHPVRSSRRLTYPVSLWIGAFGVGAVLLVALTAEYWTPYPPEQLAAGPLLAAPSAQHLFGTDNLGRDLFSRVMSGARIAILMAFGGVAIGATIGVPLGIAAGYYGRWADSILSRMMEVWLAFPALLLAILVVARFGSSLTSTIVALGIVGAPAYFRLVRSGAISGKHTLYVEAAYASGASDFRILLRHVLPFTASAVIVLASMRAGMLLLAGAGLSFIGLGVQPPTPEWGALLATGRDYLDMAPWMAVFPGLAITFTVVALNQLGDGLRDTLDPHR